MGQNKKIFNSNSNDEILKKIKENSKIVKYYIDLYNKNSLIKYKKNKYRTFHKENYYHIIEVLKNYTDKDISLINSFLEKKLYYKENIVKYLQLKKP